MIAIVAKGVVVLAAVAAMDQGCSGGEPLPGQDQGCTVTARGTNSKGQAFVTVKCDPGGNVSSDVVPGPSSYPRCVVGTVWPTCKEA